MSFGRKLDGGPVFIARLELTHVEFVFIRRQRHTARFVVAGDDHQRTRCAVGKIQCDLDCGIKIPYFGKYGCRIVVVAAVVDVRSLDHDEEPFVAVGR